MSSSMFDGLNAEELELAAQMAEEDPTQFSVAELEGLADKIATANVGQPGVAGLFAGVQQAITGTDANPQEIPELDFGNLPEGVEPQSRQMLALLPFAPDAASQADVVSAVLPEVEIEERDGRALVTFPDGTQAFVNAPGLSPRDATEFAGAAALFAPAAAAGRVAPQLGGRSLISGTVNTTSRALASGVAVGATEAGRQAAIKTLTDKSFADMDGQAIAFMTAAGAVPDLVAPLVAGAGRIVRNKFLFSGKNTLNERGRKAFADLGVDPDLVDGNPRVMAMFRRGRGITGSQAAADALVDAAPDLAVSGVITGRARGAQAAGRDIQGALQQEAKLAKAPIDKAFGDARALDATISPVYLHFQQRQVANRIVEEGRLTTPVDKALKNFEATVLGNKGPNARQTALDMTTPGNVRRWEAWRKQTSRDRRTLNKKPNNEGAEDAASLGIVIGQMDEAMEEAILNGLVRGDIDAIKGLQAGNQLRRQFAEKFEANKFVDEIITERNLTPEDSVNLLFGANTAMPGSRRETTQAMAQVKNIVGTDSEAWQAVRDQAAQQLFRRSRTQGSFDPGKFGGQWQELKRQNRSLVDELFTPGEQRIFNELSELDAGGLLSIQSAGDLLSVRYGVAGQAVAGSLRRLGGLDEQLPAARRPLIAGSIIRGGASTAVDQAGEVDVGF